MAYGSDNSDFPDDDFFGSSADGSFAPGSFAFGDSNPSAPGSFAFGNDDSSAPGSFAFGNSDPTDPDSFFGGGNSSAPGSFAFGGGNDDPAYGTTFGTRPNRNSSAYQPKQPEPGREGILLIAESKTFMVNAITKSLEDEFFEVTFSRPTPMYLDSMPDRPNLIIMYVDAATKATISTLQYLKDICQKNGSPVSIYLVGDEHEIEEAYKYLPREYTKGNFSRPLNVKLLVEKLRMNQALSVDNTSRKSILIVDDDPVMLRTIKTWLSDKYHVFMANSGANAIALLARNRVDLALLDYEMPVISGAKVFEMMRSEPSTKNIPVMFLTARDDREAVMKVSALRPERYILKGTPPDEVIGIVDDFFAKHR